MAHSTALSMSASSNTMSADLPPSSMEAGRRFWVAAWDTARPVAVEPVKAIFAMPGWPLLWAQRQFRRKTEVRQVTQMQGLRSACVEESRYSAGRALAGNAVVVVQVSLRHANVEARSGPRRVVQRQQQITEITTPPRPAQAHCFASLMRILLYHVCLPAHPCLPPPQRCGICLLFDTAWKPWHALPVQHLERCCQAQPSHHRTTATHKRQRRAAPGTPTRSLEWA